MEETNAQATEANGTTGQAATAPETQTTPPQAETVDVEAITQAAAAKAEEAAQKKMEGVFKSMLQQQGVDADTIAKMTEEWKAKQETPEKLLEQERQGRTKAEQKALTLEQKVHVLGKGIPADKADKYIKLAKGLQDESTTFEAALDEVLADIPIAKGPALAEGTGQNKIPARNEVREILGLK